MLRIHRKREHRTQEIILVSSEQNAFGFRESKRTWLQLALRSGGATNVKIAINNSEKRKKSLKKVNVKQSLQESKNLFLFPVGRKREKKCSWCNE